MYCWICFTVVYLYKRYTLFLSTFPPDCLLVHQCHHNHLRPVTTHIQYRYIQYIQYLSPYTVGFKEANDMTLRT